jgi:hypothetical protein
MLPNLCPYNTRKLQFRSKQCVFLDFRDMHKGFECLEVSTGRVYISRDVIFDENVFPFAFLHPNARACLRSEIINLSSDLFPTFFVQWVFSQETIWLMIQLISLITLLRKILFSKYWWTRGKSTSWWDAQESGVPVPGEFASGSSPPHDSSPGELAPPTSPPAATLSPA